MIIIKVFDFDNTIYRGESSIDFALFMIKHNKRILFFIPTIIWYTILYKLCLTKKDKLEKRINEVIKLLVRDKDELITLAGKFWQKYHQKLDKRILRRINEDDLIITAGPFFLIDAIKEKLNTKNLICSEVNWDKIEVAFFNFGENKVKRYRELYGDRPIDHFYTDSYNDRSMMDISDRVYIVKNGRIKSIK